MLEIINVTKTYRIRQGFLRPNYKEIDALKDVSLSIGDGETLALLGPNGAGKSTLCKIAAGMTKPTRGKALLDGSDITSHIKQISRRIGVVLGPTLIYYRLSGYKYLEFFAKIYEVKDVDQRIHELAEMLDLEGWLKTYIESYSTGMKMKISLARALLHDPPFLILDEFTMGLDPVVAKNLRSWIRGLKKTILLTTHNTLEAGAMADRIAIVTKGRIVKLETPSNLVAAASEKIRLAFATTDERSLESLAGIGVTIVRRKTGEGKTELLVPKEQLSQVIKLLSTFKIDHIETKKPSLEEAFIHFTGEKLRPEVELD